MKVPEKFESDILVLLVPYRVVVQGIEMFDIVRFAVLYAPRERVVFMFINQLSEVS